MLLRFYIRFSKTSSRIFPSSSRFHLCFIPPRPPHCWRSFHVGKLPPAGGVGSGSHLGLVVVRDQPRGSMLDYRSAWIARDD